MQSKSKDIEFNYKKNNSPGELYSGFKIFHELMSKRISEILLVSSSYDAFILEEDGSIASRIINEYSGLNLSNPPRIRRISSVSSAISFIKKNKTDLVITMPNLDNMDVFCFGCEIKKIKADLPVILLTNNLGSIKPCVDKNMGKGIDRIYLWSGNSELLLAMVKNVEDSLNVDYDTKIAGVPVLLLVEDSPVYYSTFISIIYKEIVKQTQAVLGGGLNEEHRILRMRARPKILLAQNYEEAIDIYNRYKKYITGIISDLRFPKNGKISVTAGLEFLLKVRNDMFDLPILVLSSESKNIMHMNSLSAVFLDKNSSELIDNIHKFFISHLGFGDFVFRMPGGREVGRASNLRDLERQIAQIPEKSLFFHANQNHFSKWIMGRSEITLASRLRDIKSSDFKNVHDIREYIVNSIHQLRKWRLKGIVAIFNKDKFDPDIMDFVKIGNGSLGGKARGLAFMSAMLQSKNQIYSKYSEINIKIPKTLVISTDLFNEFMVENNLYYVAREDLSDIEIDEIFQGAELPEKLNQKLKIYLENVKYPLSVRSSSLLEDARLRPYAGLYSSYMIPNNNTNISIRLDQLSNAIKLVYASTYYQDPKAYSKNVYQPHEEAMAVIVQQLTGTQYGDYFYPSFSGVALSNNFYPFSHMKPSDGVAHIALGMGKTVVDGEKSLRFCPKYPEILPQFSLIDEILNNSQKEFYALKVKGYPEKLNFLENYNLYKRNIIEAENEFPVKSVASTYLPDEHRLVDSWYHKGVKVITFAQILKYNVFPLAGILNDIMQIGRKGMGGPVEIEFSVNLSENKKKKSDFFLLQIRPITEKGERHEIKLNKELEKNIICKSSISLGNGINNTIRDIVYVKPDEFKVEFTKEIADEIGTINSYLVNKKLSYMLIGPGRWGSADRWLGIPVKWRDISGVGVIIELKNKQLNVAQSSGSHFFHNITSLGIDYITVDQEIKEDFFNWERLESAEIKNETKFVRHIQLKKSLYIVIDGLKSESVICMFD